MPGGAGVGRRTDLSSYSGPRGACGRWPAVPGSTPRGAGSRRPFLGALGRSAAPRVSSRGRARGRPGALSAHRTRGPSSASAGRQARDPSAAPRDASAAPRGAAGAWGPVVGVRGRGRPPYSTGPGARGGAGAPTRGLVQEGVGGRGRGGIGGGGRRGEDDDDDDGGKRGVAPVAGEARRPPRVAGDGPPPTVSEEPRALGAAPPPRPRDPAVRRVEVATRAAPARSRRAEGGRDAPARPAAAGAAARRGRDPEGAAEDEAPVAPQLVSTRRAGGA